MKTFLALSVILIVGNFFTLLAAEQHTLNIPTYKTSKAKKSTSLPQYPLRIVIDKSNYELYVYDSKGWYATYPVVFGNNPLFDKKMEGDKCTPEGEYRIAGKKPHSKWSRFIAIDYPSEEDKNQFEEMMRRGQVPLSAKIGGGIGIHGTWPHEDFVIDRYKNWTDGCIALKRDDVEELYSYIQIGTTITIKK